MGHESPSGEDGADPALLAPHINSANAILDERGVRKEHGEGENVGNETAPNRCAHKRGSRATAERRLEAFATGFDIARRTLFKRLRAGPPGDWDELVVAGNEP